MVKSKNIEGVGLILVRYNVASSRGYDKYDDLGFWYTSTVTSDKQVHIVFFSNNMKLPDSTSYGTTLDDVKENSMITQIKMLKYKNTCDEENLRTFLCQSFTSNERDPQKILNNLIEKIVLISPCSNRDYLEMSEFFNQNDIDDNDMSDLELKIKNMKDSLGVQDKQARTMDELMSTLEKCAFEEIKV
jgi:hypothetical protein